MNLKKLTGLHQEKRIQVGKWKNAKVTDLIRRWVQNMAAD